MVKPHIKFKPPQPPAYQPPSQRVMPRPVPGSSPAQRSPLVHLPAPAGLPPDQAKPPEKSLSASPLLQNSLLGAGSLVATIMVGSLIAEGSGQPPSYTPPANTTQPQPEVTPRSPAAAPSIAVLPTPSPPEMMPPAPSAESLEAARQNAQVAMNDATALLNQQFNVQPGDLPQVQLSAAIAPAQPPVVRQAATSPVATNPPATSPAATSSPTTGQSVAERYRAATAALPELQPAPPFSMPESMPATEPGAAGASEPQPTTATPATSQAFRAQPTHAFVQANPQTQFGVMQGRRIHNNTLNHQPAPSSLPTSEAVSPGTEAAPQATPRSIQDFLELSDQLNSRSQPAQLPLTRLAASEAADFNYLEQFLVFRLSAEEYRNLWLGRTFERAGETAPQYGFIDYRHRAIVLPDTTLARLEN